MNKSTIRVWVAYIVIILSYVGMAIFLSTRFLGTSDSNFDVLTIALVYGLTSIISGILGGVIAPYSYKALIKKLIITLGIILLLAGILIAIFSNTLFNSEGLGGIIIILLFFLFIIGLAVVLVVTTGGLLLGALLGSLIGKSFQADYVQKEDDAVFDSMPTLE